MQKPTPPLDITSEEAKRIEESMKDPAFRKELMNYLQEMSKPEARAEMEETLRLAEAGLAPGGMALPEGKRMLFPQPFSILEARVAGKRGGGKVYVNLVVHDDVEPIRGGADGAMEFPHVCGPSNMEYDLEELAAAGGKHEGLTPSVRAIDVCFSAPSLKGCLLYTSPSPRD